MENKPIYQSKTFWTNVLLALLPLFPGVGAQVAAHPEYMGYLFAGVNILLRLISKDKVSLL